MQNWNPEAIEFDGLSTMPIKRHSLEKYALVKFYAYVFAKAMRSKWDLLAYIDLFCGPGVSHLTDKNSYVETPALSLLKQDIKFDRYIFCDKSEESIAALESRAKKYPAVTCSRFMQGDCNIIHGDIADCMPNYSRENRVLSLCYVDPFNIGNLKFSTIKALSRFYIDFLVLIPTHMDANRNLESVYIKEGHTSMAEFLGSPNWREKYEVARESGTADRFVLNEFVNSMSELGYIPPPEGSIFPIKHYEKNYNLYHLALFSRNKLGEKFWKQARQFTNPQAGFDF